MTGCGKAAKAIYLAVALTGTVSTAQAEAPADDRACADIQHLSLSEVTLEAVTPEGDFRLGDGRILRLASVLTGTAGADPLRLAAHVPDWRGRTLQLQVAADTAQDRWGRVTGDLVDSKAQGGIRHLGLALLRTGDGLVQPGHSDMACRAALVAAELQARRKGLGLWSATPRIKALKAADGASVMALLGQHIVMEGPIVSISERTAMVYLNFARRWRDGATVTVSRRLWRDMAIAGWSKEAAEGRLVRVRGIIENSGTGPILALSSGAAIEALD